MESIQLIIFHTYVLNPYDWLWNIKHCNEYQKCRSISPSAQLTSAQLKVIIENKKNKNQCSWKNQTEVECEEVLDPDNTS